MACVRRSRRGPRLRTRRRTDVASALLASRSGISGDDEMPGVRTEPAMESGNAEGAESGGGVAGGGEHDGGQGEDGNQTPWRAFYPLTPPWHTGGTLGPIICRKRQHITARNPLAELLLWFVIRGGLLALSLS